MGAESNVILRHRSICNPTLTLTRLMHFCKTVLHEPENLHVILWTPCLKILVFTSRSYATGDSKPLYISQ